MQIGIIGLPNIGKSTLFKAITNIQVDINNYPFCTIEPNIGVVEVPDERVDKLSIMFNSKKKLYATIEFVDIAGLVKGAAEGEGLGNKFLHNVREVDALIQVVRIFENTNITHVHETIDPKRDIEIIETELILADMETTEKRLAKLIKETKSTTDKDLLRKKELVGQLKNILDENSLTQVQDFIKSLEEKDLELIQDLHLLSFKPILYIFNTTNPESIKTDLQKHAIDLPEESYLALDIKTEEELLELDDEEKKELGLKSELTQLITKSYALLNLIVFLTTGEDETRSWSIPKDSTAPRAGRAIHGDFEDKFICADVIAYDDLISSGSRTTAKEKGLARVEGKGYIVQDGDVIEFKV
jgi:GTP-binding protein YchF